VDSQAVEVGLRLRQACLEHNTTQYSSPMNHGIGISKKKHGGQAQDLFSRSLSAMLFLWGASAPPQNFTERSDSHWSY
jgi:hypothetical protein